MTNKDSDNGDDNPEVLSAMLMLFNISHLFSLWCHCCHPEDFRVEFYCTVKKTKFSKFLTFAQFSTVTVSRQRLGYEANTPYQKSFSLTN